MAQVQSTIQKCQLILDYNGAFVAKIKHDVERTRQSLQPGIALLKQMEASEAQHCWPTFVCCEGHAGAGSDSSRNSDDSSSFGDESVRVREENTTPIPLNSNQSPK
jgi:hypothetical protein